MRKIKETYIDEEGYTVKVYEDGTKYWYKNGKLHRDNDKPAIVYADGSKVWLKNGKRHRDGDKPAIVWNDEPKYWYKNDMYHRENNEAMVNNSTRFFALYNHQYQSKEYWIRLLLMEY